MYSVINLDKIASLFCNTKNLGKNNHENENVYQDRKFWLDDIEGFYYRNNFTNNLKI